MTAAIARFDHTTKAYHLGRERHSLRAAIPGRFGEARAADQFLAVDDVSFDIGEGESVGVIGRNGAGKSTLLRLLTGVTRPTSGAVRRRGRVAGMLELGIGFHPDLTGMENLHLGAELLGLTRAELAARLDDIIDFADIGPFLDTAVKRYSSGMQARLGFALATNVGADLLVIDEALSVGDIDFQRRSAERIAELHRDGSALVFVSHNLWLTSQLCETVAYLEAGRLAAFGPGTEVILDYQDTAEQTRMIARVPAGQFAARLHTARCDPTVIDPGDGLVVEFDVEVKRPSDDALVMAIHTVAGRVIMARWIEDPTNTLQEVGSWTITVDVKSFRVSPGSYLVSLAVMPPTAVITEDHDLSEAHDRITAAFDVRGPVSQRPGIVIRTDWLRAGDTGRSVGPFVGRDPDERRQRSVAPQP